MVTIEPIKKASKKKPVAKKLEQKKTEPKKVAVKKDAVPAKKDAPKVAPRKVAPAKKSTTEKALAEKPVPSKKSEPKKVTPPKTEEKSAPKQDAKKAEVKKSAPKKVESKKVAVKKVALKKEVAKKAAPKKEEPQKVEEKKSTPPKVTPAKKNPSKKVSPAPATSVVVPKTAKAKKGAPAAQIDEQSLRAAQEVMKAVREIPKEGGYHDIVRPSGTKTPTSRPRMAQKGQPHFSDAELEDFGRNLRRMHEETLRQLKATREGALQRPQEENIEEDGDTYNRNADLNRADEQHTRLRAIEAALLAVKNRTYGICATCGCLIPRDRLRAKPFAIRCVNCREQYEQDLNRLRRAQNN